MAVDARQQRDRARQPERATGAGLWWVTNAAGHVCFAEGRFPQANKSRSVAERAVGAVPGAVSVTRLPVAYVPVDSRDLLHAGGHRHDAEVSYR